MSGDVFQTEPERSTSLPIAEAVKQPRKYRKVSPLWGGISRLACGTTQIAQRAIALKSGDPGSADVLHGPQCVNDLQRWPVSQASEVFASKLYSPNLLMRRASSFFSAGFILNSNFSGRLCAEAGVRMQVKGMRLAGAQVAERSVVAYSTNEKNTECRKLIGASLHRPCHCFKEVSAHLPNLAWEEIKKMRPPALPKNMRKKGMAADAKKALLETARRAYNQQKLYLRQHRAELFRSDRRAECTFHPGKSCQMVWTRVPQVPAEQQPVNWDWSGPMCVAFTPMGSQLADADQTTESLQIHTQQVVSSDLDVFTIENSERMPGDSLVQAISDYPKWFLVPLFLNILRNGWPGRRGRSWRTCINQDRFFWVGPRDTAGIQRHFDSMFRRTCDMVADQYIVSSNSEEDRFRRVMAAKRGNYPRGDQQLSPKECITAMGYKRFVRFEAEFKKAPKGSCFVADVSQNIEARKRVGEILPSACTSSQFFSFSRDRYFTDTDMAVSQGWPVCEEGKDYAELVASSYKMGPGMNAKVVGNGMHLSQVGAVLLYISTHTLRREEVLKMIPITQMPLASRQLEKADSAGVPTMQELAIQATDGVARITACTAAVRVPALESGGEEMAADKAEKADEAEEAADQASSRDRLDDDAPVEPAFVGDEEASPLAGFDDDASVEPAVGDEH